MSSNLHSSPWKVLIHYIFNYIIFPYSRNRSVFILARCHNNVLCQHCRHTEAHNCAIFDKTFDPEFWGCSLLARFACVSVSWVLSACAGAFLSLCPKIRHDLELTSLSQRVALRNVIKRNISYLHSKPLANAK